MVSGSQGGKTGQTVGGRAWQKWPVTGVVVTRSGSRRPLATPLLRNQEVILHPFQALRLRIAIVVNARHGEPSHPSVAARLLRLSESGENLDPDRQRGMGIPPR